MLELSFLCCLIIGTMCHVQEIRSLGSSNEYIGLLYAKALYNRVPQGWRKVGGRGKRKDGFVGGCTCA